jgi:radical SAM superfamily enzyme YgiQ (UPF0313 family)
VHALLTHAYFLAHDPRERELMRPFPPLGIQYLVSWLRDERGGGWNADWWDATFAPGPEAFPAVLDSARPKLVGFYGHTLTRPVTAGMVREALSRGCRVVAGGPDPVQYLDEYLDTGVEVVVIGEGEVTLSELLAHLAANAWRFDLDSLDRVRGIAFRRDGRIVRTEPRPLIRPLDSIPWPHRQRSDLQAYFSAWRARHKETAMSLTTSRGCPFHCAWCSKQVYGDSFRRREPDAVIDELLAIKDQFGPDQLWFVDDMFTLNKAWVHRFCAAMVRRGAVTPFYVIGRAETLDPPLLEAMRAAGCTRMFVSAESGADHVLDAMVKGTTVAEIDRAGQMLRAAGIEMGVFVMLGYPGERKPDILATRDLLRRLDPAVTLLSIAHPMKGTAFYDEVEERINGSNGGRLRFRMEYGPRVYEAAQHMLWADEAFRQARQRRRVMDAARAGLKYAGWRGAFELAR